MKLSIVQLKEKVPTVSVSDTTSRLNAEPGHGSAQGWELTFEAGIVTATKGEHCMLIPVGNVAFMRLMPSVVVEPKAKGRVAA